MADETRNPKSWKDIIADGIEEARASTLEAVQEAWTGEKVTEERFEYQQIDLGSFFASGTSTAPQEAEQGQDKENER